MTEVCTGDIVEWGPVTQPVLDSFHSHASLNSMRTFPVGMIARFPDRQGRMFLVFYTNKEMLLEMTHQAVLAANGQIILVGTQPSPVIRESPPAFYLDSGAEVNVHRIIRSTQHK